MTKKITKPKGKETGKGRHSPIPPELALERRMKAWTLRVTKRMTHEQIQLALNELYPAYPLKTRQAVTEMLKTSEREFVQTHQDEVATYKAEHLALLDWAMVEAIDAWDRSKGLIKTVKKKADQPIEQSAKDGIGDPNLLLRVIQAASEKGKILGLYAPAKFEGHYKFDLPAWLEERKKRLKQVRDLKE